MPPDGDPGAVTAIAVAAEDVVAAYEHNLDHDTRAVLRLTPPFHGRMRARLHVEGGGYDTEPAPIHLPPERLLEGVPDRPSADETADDLRADPTAEYAVETHRERHAAAMAAWRDAVLDAVVGTVTVETPAGTCEASVTLLGADGTSRS